MRKIIVLLATIGIGASAAACICNAATVIKQAKAGSGPTYTSTLPTTIYLNDKTDSEIRGYYSSLNSLTAEERTGTNLLKNLRPILQDFNYYSYSAVWKIYEITDREWALSPASGTTYGTYNSASNSITNYSYGTSASNGKNNPYIHTLYRNRDANGVTVTAGRIKEWGDHSQEGGTNREHVWCQSRGFKASSGAEGPAGTDVHHLISGDGYVNGKPHNNNPYGYVDTAHIDINSANAYSYCAGNISGAPLHPHAGDQATTVFEPQDSDKGDIARACFYMVACYNNLGGHNGITQYNPNLTLVDYASSNSKSEISSNDTAIGMGILSDLLEWHKLDPVDEYEIHRNNLIDRNYQHNRNPFIDFPEWVDYIWGDKVGTAAKPTSDTINGYNSTDPTPDSSEPISSSSEEMPSSESPIDSSSEESSSSVPTPSGTEFYQKIESKDDLTNGSYVIAANIDGDYYSLTTISGSSRIAGEEISLREDGAIDYVDGCDFAFNIEKSGDAYLISEPEGTYLGGATSTNLTFGASFKWSISQKADASRGTFAIDSPTNTRSLLFRTTDSNKNYYCFGYYSTSNRGTQYYYDIELFKYTIPPYEYEEGYKLVASTAELTDGASVVIGGNKDGVWEIAGAQKTNNINAVSAALPNNYIASTDPTFETFTIGHSDGLVTFKDKENQYLYAASSSKNYLKRQADVDGNAKWTVAISSEGATSIVATGSSNRNVMQYNSADSLFACYASASQQAVYLFVNVKTALLGFVNSYMHLDDYTSNLGYCKDDDHHYFDTAKEQLLAMGETYIEAFKGDTDFADARARYEAWAEANSANAYQEGSNGAYNAPTAIISGDSPWWMTVGIALITGASVIVFAAFKRKRA